MLIIYAFVFVCTFAAIVTGTELTACIIVCTKHPRRINYKNKPKDDRSTGIMLMNILETILLICRLILQCYIPIMSISSLLYVREIIVAMEYTLMYRNSYEEYILDVNLSRTIIQKAMKIIFLSRVRQRNHEYHNNHHHQGGRKPIDYLSVQEYNLLVETILAKPYFDVRFDHLAISNNIYSINDLPEKKRKSFVTFSTPLYFGSVTNNASETMVQDISWDSVLNEVNDSHRFDDKCVVCLQRLNSVTTTKRKSTGKNSDRSNDSFLLTSCGHVFHRTCFFSICGLYRSPTKDPQLSVDDNSGDDHDIYNEEDFDDSDIRYNEEEFDDPLDCFSLKERRKFLEGLYLGSSSSLNFKCPICRSDQPQCIPVHVIKGSNF